MLLESGYKIVANIMHSRLLPIAEKIDHESQCGFRPGRSCNDAIFAVKLALKKRHEHNLETWILFLDLVHFCLVFMKSLLFSLKFPLMALV